MAGYRSVKLFAKGKGEARSEKGSAPAFTPIDRNGLLSLLDQVVNSGQTGVIELREARGAWTYAFQGGALVHASGGRVRGARQAFDLLWEFGTGEVKFTPGTNPALVGNLYIDKSRLLDLLRRSQAVLQGPAAPYIPPDQQRPIPQPQRYSPPNPGQMPQPWQPPAGVQGQPPMPQWPQPTVQPPVPGWNPAAAGPPPGYPTPYPAQYPAPMPGAYPPGYPQAAQPFPPAGQPGPSPYPPMQAAAPQPAPPMAPPAAIQPPAPVPPPAAPVPPPAPTRQVTPPSFSVPPMAIPRKKDVSYQPPVAAVPVPPAAAPEPPAAAPKDDLQALRASLVAQAPAARPTANPPNWGVRTSEGTVAPPPPANAKGKGKGTAKAKTKGKSRLRQTLEVQLIKFLLWACERKYSPDDHWTLKDAFEVSTMELRDQFFGAFSQSFQSNGKSKRADDDDMDDMAAGRMRGRGRRH